MTLIILLLVMLSLVFFLKSWVNRYSWFFLVLALSMAVAMYSVIHMIAVNGIYQPINILGWLDERYLTAWVVNRRNFFSIIRIFNVSVALYTGALPLFVSAYFSSRYLERDPKRIFKRFVFFIFPLFYVFFYDRQTTYYLYQQVLGGRVSFALLSVADAVCYALLIAYMCVPLLDIFAKYRQIRTSYKRRQIIGVAILVASLNTVFTMIYWIAMIRKPYFLSDVFDLISVTDVCIMNTNEYMTVFWSMLILIALMFFVMFQFDVAPQIGTISRLVFARNIQRLNKNLVNIFHSVKKTMFLYKIMAEKALREDGAQSKETIKQLAGEMDGYIEHLTRMLDVNNDVEIFMEKINIIDVMKSSVSHYAGAGEISFHICYDSREKIFVEGDSFYLEDVFDNIIKNSIEAIKRQTGRGTVTIEIDTEHEWVVIRVTDDGEGISKQDLKRIFKPLFTTKSRTNNWGIGLSFALKIIKIHMGHIFVESSPGEGATIQILLPRRG